jgi:tetratricopeptide (TPR) repeat protein
LPTTIVIDREGKLAHVISAYKSDYRHVLEAYIRHALGELTDEALQEVLAAETFQRGRPEDKIARHRAAARLLRANGLPNDAERELHAALEIDAEDAETLLDLASLRLERGAVNEATALVDRVLKRQPHHRRGRLLHGVALLRAGRLDEAEHVLTEALALNPDPTHILYYLGQIAERKGEADVAAEYYRKALDRLLAEQPL